MSNSKTRQTHVNFLCRLLRSSHDGGVYPSILSATRRRYKERQKLMRARLDECAATLEC